jgi:hypothetical protein
MGLEAVLVSVNEGRSRQAIIYLGGLDRGNRAPRRFGPPFLIPWICGQRFSRGGRRDARPSDSLRGDVDLTCSSDQRVDPVGPPSLSVEPRLFDAAPRPQPRRGRRRIAHQGPARRRGPVPLKPLAGVPPIRKNVPLLAPHPVPARCGSVGWPGLLRCALPAAGPSAHAWLGPSGLLAGAHAVRELN